ncbi:hypothetical protein AQI88_26920 [Streptomyces cellostaticus]|uniref:NB-ARC domain-containing protein n=1 Tax=Streptomyces cellostaticus TaxID=67285 RepID=A0A124HC62_9ACTN|nr:hypothetical protein AQI88_26920 [Streptomyces cellostaticus]GHI02243.1 hypothetical protein Scel_05640 [Streptomyces cellostaticus]
MPARFQPLAAVLAVLITEARKKHPRPSTPGLYDMDSWLALWRSAQAVPVGQPVAERTSSGAADGQSPSSTCVPGERRQTVPRQLPPATARLVGRQAELAMLSRLLDEDAAPGTAVISAISAISAITGTAGVGKTSLAVWWAHQVAHHFPDGQLYVNLRGFDPSGQPMAPADAVRGFLDALAVSVERMPTSLDAQVGLYRSLLADRRVLVLLDNARDADHVRPLLPGSPTCLALVTSRNQLSGLTAQGAQRLALDLFTEAEGHELLACRLGAERTTQAPDAVGELVRLCARLPLALSIAASRGVTQPNFPLSALVDELREAAGPWDLLDGGDTATNAEAVFSWSCRHLSEPAARMFRLLGLHPGPDISLPAAASLAAVTPGQARRALRELSRASLLAEHVPGRYAFHDLLRAYATELSRRLDSEAERRSAILRVLDHYLHTAHDAHQLLSPVQDLLSLSVSPPRSGTTPERLSDGEQALAWCETEHPVLLSAISYAGAVGLDVYARDLPLALFAFLSRRARWYDQITTQREALAAALRLRDRNGAARVHFCLSHVHTQIGLYDEARTYAERSLALYQETGDQAGQSFACCLFSWMCGQQDRHRDGLAHARRALELARACGHRVGQAMALTLIGSHHSRSGDPQQAIRCCQEAIELCRSPGEREFEAYAWEILGYAHQQLGDCGRAAACYQQAVTLFGTGGYRFAQAAGLTRLGEAHRVAGRLDAAREAWQQSLDIYAELDVPEADAARVKLAHLFGAPCSLPVSEAPPHATGH